MSEDLLAPHEPEGAGVQADPVPAEPAPVNAEPASSMDDVVLVRAFPGWPSGVAVREGVRTLLSGRWLSVALVSAVIGLCTLAGLADARNAAEIADAEQVFVRSGGNVLIIRNEAHGISGHACDRLQGQAGVVASAGITRREDPVVVTASPGIDLTAFYVTPGFWKLLGAPGAARREAVMLAEDADRLGMRAHDIVRFAPTPGTGVEGLPRSAVQVDVAEGQILDDDTRGVFLLTSPTERVDACWVEAVPGRTLEVKDLLMVLLNDGHGVPVIAERLFRGEFSRDFSHDFAHRPFRHGGLLAGALIAGCVFFLRWIRRGQAALRATLGANLKTRLLLHGSEWLTVLVLAGPWAFAVPFIWSVALRVPPGLAAPAVAHQVAAALLIGSAAVVVAAAWPSRSVLADLKDR